MPSFEDREAGAIATLVILVLFIPAVVLLVMLFLTAWAVALGEHNIHARLWGWLSHTHQDSAGHTRFTPANWTYLYFLGLVTVSLGYQIGEGVYALGRELAQGMRSNDERAKKKADVV